MHTKRAIPSKTRLISDKKSALFCFRTKLIRSGRFLLSEEKAFEIKSI
jgi:hypothetical protein